MLLKLQVGVQKSIQVERETWKYETADWSMLKDTLAEYPWDNMHSMGADEAAQEFINVFLASAEASIGNKH